MKSYIVCLALLCTGYSASASLYNYIWALDANGVAACYPANISGAVSTGAAAVPNQFCQYSFAWSDVQNVIQCMAVGPNGQFLAGAMPVPEQNCARAFIFATDANGQTACFGEGPDGNVVPGIPPVDPQYCNTP
jgi:hypothetical protein